MTRKRFIKLLMAQGYSRNEARELARSGNKGQPYTELYFMVCTHNNLPIWLDCCAEIARGACEAAAEIMQSFLSDGYPRMVQIITEATRQAIEELNRFAAAAEGKPSE